MMFNRQRGREPGVAWSRMLRVPFHLIHRQWVLSPILQLSLQRPRLINGENRRFGFSYR